MSPLPRARTRASAIYDAANDRLILFGGFDGFNQRFDVWALPLSGTPLWSQITAAGLPPAGRSARCAIYDAPRQRMVIFGGTNGTTDLRDAWELSLDASPTWNKIVTQHLVPPRSGAGAAFDSAHDRMLVFGGHNGGGYSDTWSLSFSGVPDWTQIATGAGPSARGDVSVVYDPDGDQLALFGGNDGAPEQDAWTLSLSGTPAWQALTPSGVKPLPRAAHASVLDPLTHRMVIYGGSTTYGPLADVWALSLSGASAWTPLNPPAPAVPPGPFINPVRNYTAVLDPVARVLIQFGGEVNGLLSTNNLVTFDLSSPIVAPAPIATGLPPSPRYAAEAAWDPVRDRMLMFGGTPGNGTVFLNEVWEYRPRPVPHWTQLPAGGTAPIGRMACGWVYDSGYDRMLMFAGFNNGISLGDVWELPLSGPDAMKWNPLSPAGTAPSGRWGFVAVADPARHRILMFGGGADEYQPTQDLFALDVSTRQTSWSRISPSGQGPAGRIIQAGVIDPIGDRFVIFGGFSGSTFLNDVWAVSLSRAPAWTQLHPSGAVPVGRDAVTAIYDPAGARMVVPCGFSAEVVTGGGFLNDVWSLTWDAATPATASLIDSHAEPGLVRLNWFVTDAASAVVTVQRQHGAEAWTTLGAPASTASDRLTFEDRSVVAGESYRYRLNLREGGNETLTDAVEIAVPTGYTLELAGATPNPAIGSNLRVTLSLPRAMPARLDLIDVSGRRVASRDLSGLAAGRQTIALGDGARLAPGLYVIRLEADGHALTKKALVVK